MVICCPGSSATSAQSSNSTPPVYNIVFVIHWNFVTRCKPKQLLPKRIPLKDRSFKTNPPITEGLKEAIWQHLCSLSTETMLPRIEISSFDFTILYIQECSPYVYCHLNAKIMNTECVLSILWAMEWFHEYKYIQTLTQVPLKFNILLHCFQILHNISKLLPF
jgi:hypothetical protein